MQNAGSVEETNVPRLNRRQAANRPAQVHEVWLDRVREWMHPDLCGQSIPLSRVARAAGRHDVGPDIRAASREWNEVVARERLTRPEFRDRPPAELAAIAVAGEQERVGDLAAEAARDVDELRQADDRRARQGEPFGTHRTACVGFDDFGLAIDDKSQCTLQRHHRHGSNDEFSARHPTTNFPSGYELKS